MNSLPSRADRDPNSGVTGRGRAAETVHGAETVHAVDTRRELESQFRHSQRLENLGLLAGGIAHDLNNLLTVVLGNATLAQGYLPEDAGDALAALKRAERAAQRCAALSRQMLAYSGRGTLAKEEIDLAELIESLVELLESALDRRHRFVHELARHLPPILGDPAQIQQVVLNLLTNASEALGERRGAVTLTSVVAKCDAARLRGAIGAEEASPGRFVGFEVSDDGAGMDPETQARLFDPFFTTKRSGHGLGLSAVLGIVRGHKGFLELDSRLGRGTRVRVWFPAAEPQDLKESGSYRIPVGALSPAEAVCQGETVLVVDDDAEICATAAEILGCRGYSVLIAADGEEAVEQMAAKDEIRLVLIDPILPTMSSAEFLQRLDDSKYDGKILIHGSSGTKEQLASVHARHLPFLQKPWDEHELAHAVQRVLRSS